MHDISFLLFLYSPAVTERTHPREQNHLYLTESFGSHMLINPAALVSAHALTGHHEHDLAERHIAAVCCSGLLGPEREPDQR